MKDFTMNEWRCLGKPGRHIGNIGSPLSSLWEWTLTSRASPTLIMSASSPALEPISDQARPVEAAKSQLRQSLLRFTAVGKKIALAVDKNPTKVLGSEQMLDGWHKADPPTAKKLPVEAGVPEYLCRLGTSPSATPLEAAVGDLTTIAFYYLLRVGEYTCKSLRNSSSKLSSFGKRM
jgi:hypothetical protein